MPLPTSLDIYAYILPPEELTNSPHSTAENIFNQDVEVGIEIYSLSGATNCSLLEIEGSVPHKLAAIDLEQFPNYRFPTFCLLHTAFYGRDGYRSVDFPDNYRF